MPGRQPSAVAGAFAWVTTPRASMSAPSPIRAVIMPDRGGGDAECREIVEPGDAGLVAPDPGIVEDRRGDPELRREIGGIDAAMRAVDDDRALRLGRRPG